MDLDDLEEEPDEFDRRGIIEDVVSLARRLYYAEVAGPARILDAIALADQLTAKVGEFQTLAQAEAQLRGLERGPDGP
jgi:hypothetical protein